MRVPYSWLMEYLDADTAPQDLAHILTMGGLEVEEVREWTSEDGAATDFVLHTKLTANRGDMLSMVGVARQAAALLGVQWCLPSLQRPETTAPVTTAPLAEHQGVKIEVIAPDGCPRYSALAIRDLKIGPSPDWLRYRLEAAGIRPISNVVDATNYVCWELGQPMHAFDLRLVARDHIIVRRAAAGEKLKLLNEDTLELSERDLMICDEMGPVALAGVMGGLETEVGGRTRAVLLESAHFDPTSVRRSAQRHGLGSEASYRFERFVDPNLTLPALARATELVLQTAGGTPDSIAIDVRERDFPALQVSLRPERCNALLGTDFAPELMADCLTRIGFEVVPGEALQVTVPTFRPDVEREVDLIEEIAIIHGYNNIPLTVPGQLRESGLLSARQKSERRARQLLRQCGLNETIAYSFMGMRDLDRCGYPADAPERAALMLKMPVSTELSHLRTTLLPGLLEACSINVRQRVLDVALYDMDKVFVPRGERELPVERVHVGGILMGMPLTSSWNLPAESQTVDYYWLKGVVEQLCDGVHVTDLQFRRAAHPSLHPGRCAEVVVAGEVAGILGEVSATVQDAFDLPRKAYAFELDLEVLLGAAAAFRAYDPLPRFPAANRDIALVVADDEAHSAAALQGAIREAAGPGLWTVEAFDLFMDPQRLGEGRKSLAFRLAFRAADRTLTDEELDASMASIAAHLSATLGAQVRDS